MRAMVIFPRSFSSSYTVNFSKHVDWSCDTSYIYLQTCHILFGYNITDVQDTAASHLGIVIIVPSEVAIKFYKTYLYELT